jgi:hypothetical protein
MRPLDLLLLAPRRVLQPLQLHLWRTQRLARQQSHPPCDEMPLRQRTLVHSVGMMPTALRAWQRRRLQLLWGTPTSRREVQVQSETRRLPLPATHACCVEWCPTVAIDPGSVSRNPGSGLGSPGTNSEGFCNNDLTCDGSVTAMRMHACTDGGQMHVWLFGCFTLRAYASTVDLVHAWHGSNSCTLTTSADCAKMISMADAHQPAIWWLLRFSLCHAS